MRSFLDRVRARQQSVNRGQTVAEYVVILAAIAAVLFATFSVRAQNVTVLAGSSGALVAAK